MTVGILPSQLRRCNFKLDLENNIAVAVCLSGAYFTAPHPYSLTITPTKEESSQTFEELKAGKTPNLLGSLLVVQFTAPKNWDMIDGLKFSHLDEDLEKTAGDNT